MKRILGFRIWVCLMGLSVFFTGCNNGSVSTSGSAQTSGETVPPYSTEAEETRETVGKKNVEESLAQEANSLMDSRLEGLGGKPAFYMPENHSRFVEDLKVFEVLGLVDGYFYYAYVTRDTAADQDVRVIMKYNYLNGSKSTLYEGKVGERKGSSLFFSQMYQDAAKKWKIVVYDNGDLFVVDEDGKTLFERSSQDGDENLTDMLKLVFHVDPENGEYFDLDVTNIVTDGQYRFFIPVSLTKTDYTKIEDDSEEDIEVDSYIFQYDYLPLRVQDNSTGEYLIQYNENAQQQIDYWIGLADSAKNDRSETDDWKEAVRKYPDKWVTYKMTVKRNNYEEILSTLYKWKGKEREFAFQDGVPTAKPANKEMEIPSSLKEGQGLDGYFFIDNMKYYSLHGKIEKIKTETRKASRTYSYTTTNSSNETTEHTVTEQISYNWRKRADFKEGTVAEGFQVVRLPNFGSKLNLAGGTGESGDKLLIGMYMENIFALSEVTSSSFDAKGGAVFPSTESEYSMSILNQVNNSNYVMASDVENGLVFIGPVMNIPSIVIALKTSDLNHSGYQESEKDEPFKKELDKVSQKDEKTKFDFSDTDLYSNPDRFGKNNILVMGDGKLLITTLYNGMQLYEWSGNTSSDLTKSSPGTVSVLSGWPLYQSWVTGENQVTTIGFDRDDTSYSYSDIANARAYTFDINQKKKGAPTYSLPLDLDAMRKEIEETTSPQVPDEYQGLWEEAEKERDKKKSATASEASTASGETAADPETVPEVTIYETEEYIKEEWESRQAELESQRAAQESSSMEE